MRVLIAGASGFIGHALADALARDGHEVVRVSRRGDLAVDFTDVPGAAWWAARLQGIDAVVNAVGILREHGKQTFDALHTRAPVELFRASAQVGVPVVVQVSALGADAHAQSRYHLSKKAADDALRALPLDAAIVQPSLVYGPGGSSAHLFDTLAAAPLLMLPGGGTMRVQPVHIDDVVGGIVKLLVRERPRGVVTLAFAGPRELELREYLARLRRSLGIAGRAVVLPFPVALFRAFAGIAGRIPGSFLDGETAQMLLAGNVADARPFAQLLGREPRGVESFVEPGQVEPQRVQAVLGVWLPVLRVALAAMWIWTGIVSLGLYPVHESLALLSRVGLHGALATAALYGAALLDIALGIATLAWRRPWVWAAQVALIAGYTVLITLFLPEYWLHPYGPISKNLPVLAAIALLWAMDAKARR
jgi:uncharacterized protein YbjT (DUF2867 family)